MFTVRQDYYTHFEPSQSSNLDGWMVWCLSSFSTVFKSYQDDGEAPFRFRFVLILRKAHY